MERLTENDLAKCLAVLPPALREILVGAGSKLFVAGGFIRDLLSGDEPSDIDVFGEADWLLAAAADLQTRLGGRYAAGDPRAQCVVRTTPNLIEVTELYTGVNPPMPLSPIQFITRWPSGGPRETIGRFDFTCCGAALWWDRIQEQWDSAIHHLFYEHCKAGKLFYTFPDREELPAASLLRTIKLVSRGWEIDAGSLAGVVARFVAGSAEVPRGAADEPALIEEFTKRLLSAADPKKQYDPKKEAERAKAAARAAAPFPGDEVSA